MNTSLMTRAVKLEINLDNIKDNIKEVKKHMDENVLTMATVKGNAYGHGAITLSKVFLENGIDRLAVSTLLEGMELRKSDIRAPILIMNYTPPIQYDKIIEYDLIQNIYSYQDAKELSDLATRLGKRPKIHLKIDTGMGRIGFLPNELSIREIINISKLPMIDIEGIYTHFAKSDEGRDFTDFQYKRFIQFVEDLEESGIKIPIKHISNSAALLNMPEYSLNMVRLGIILYGHYPSESLSKNLISLKPAMALKTCISNIKELPKGTGISYNQTFVTSRDSRIATLPIGYADGYSRTLSNKGEVYVEGRRAPIVGTICMDQMMIDITDIENVSKDSEVVLFDYREGILSMEEVAEKLGTINYEVMSTMGRRLPRVYIEDGQIKNIVDYLLNS